MPLAAQFGAASSSQDMLAALAGQGEPTPPAPAPPAARKALFTAPPGTSVVGPPRGGAQLNSNAIRGGADCGATRSAAAEAPPAVGMKPQQPEPEAQPSGAPVRIHPNPLPVKAPPPPAAKPANPLPFKVAGAATTAPAGGAAAAASGGAAGRPALNPLPLYTLESGEGGKACWRPAPTMPAANAKSA